MGSVGGSRHYDGGGLGDERGWKRPGCGAVNLGLIAHGCQLCGAGAPGHKGEAPPPPPEFPAWDKDRDQAPPAEVRQGDVADVWAARNPDVSIAEAYRVGYADGVAAARQVPPAPPQSPALAAPDATIARTVVAALELFRDQILSGDPEEVRTGEWLSADQVTAFIQQILQSETPMPNVPRRLFTATLILGVPGAGKTSLLAPFAEYLWETFGKILLLYSWDGGAIPTDLQKLMQQGLIRFWRARTRSGEGLGIEGLMLATKGYWPAKINPETGETSPGVRLVPPMTTRYTVTCRKTGETLAQLPASNLVAPTYCTPCKTLHPVAELNVHEDVHRTKGFELVGGVAFDGLTSMGSLVLDHMDEARGAGQIGGEKSAFGGVVVSGSVKFGGSNRADVGFGQTRARQCVHNSLSIPYLVEGPVFTALSMEATDEGGLPIVGAKLPGRAATDEASAWFGNVFEMGKTTDEHGAEHFTLFLRPFTDAQNRRHLLKTSASPTGLPAMLVDPIDKPWAQANLGLVFELLNEDLFRKMAEASPAGAPGLAGTPTEDGEPFQLLPSAQPQAAPAPGALPALPAATPAFTTPAPVVPVTPPSGAPPTVTARKRVRTDPAPTTTTTTPTTTEAPALAAVGPPPPPGMKPPAKAPGT